MISETAKISRFSIKSSLSISFEIVSEIWFKDLGTHSEYNWIPF